VDKRPNKEYGLTIALGKMMSLAPKIDELRCFVDNTIPDLISLTETWLNMTLLASTILIFLALICY
jgi:hypothetical protein